jgi:hypothetical protein
MGGSGVGWLDVGAFIIARDGGERGTKFLYAETAEKAETT